MYDFISIGDSTLDVFLMISEATVACQLKKEQCLLCFEYAEKIPVDEVIKVNGAGNASNAAVGASRLGLKSAIVSVLGNDEIGKDILLGWKKERVSAKYVQIDQKSETNYSTVLNFQSERTILVHAEKRVYRLPKLDGTHWIYYTSLGAGHERLEKQLLSHLKKNPQQKMCFNPGTKHLRRGLSAIKPVIAHSDVFIVNKQEAERLLEDGVRPMENLLMRFHKLGAGIVVITDGPNGSYATDGEHMWFCPIIPGKVVERTGAGDCFATTFVCALHWGWDIPTAMLAGSANSRSVVQKVGPQAGLLSKNALAKVVKASTKYRAKPYHGTETK